jgi:hypothetical protein
MEYLQQYAIGALIGAVIGFIIGIFVRGGKTGGYLPIVEKVEPIGGQFAVIMVPKGTDFSQPVTLNFHDKCFATGGTLTVSNIELCGPLVYLEPNTPLGVQKNIRASSTNTGLDLNTTAEVMLAPSSTYVARLFASGSVSGGGNTTQKYDWVIITPEP